LNVSRPVLLYIGAEGTVVSNRDILINFPANERPMPFASVETQEEATALTVLMCECQPIAHMHMPRMPWYTYRPFGGSFEEIQRAANEFETYYQAMLNKLPSVKAAA